MQTEKTIDLSDLASDRATLRYAKAKELLRLAEAEPLRLYPSFQAFVELLDNDKNILRWAAIRIIGLLAKVDMEDRIGAVKARLFALLNQGNMITANNTIQALGLIGVSKPEWRQEITREIIAVERYDYETPECRNIAMGKAIEALSAYCGQLEDREEALKFSRRQTANTRPATRKKAERFLQKFGQDR